MKSKSTSQAVSLHTIELNLGLCTCPFPLLDPKKNFQCACFFLIWLKTEKEKQMKRTYAFSGALAGNAEMETKDTLMQMCLSHFSIFCQHMSLDHSLVYVGQRRSIWDLALKRGQTHVNWSNIDLE